MVNPRLEVDGHDVVPLGSKPVMKHSCGAWAKALLQRGCRRVVIVWDLLPAWGEYEGKGCRHDDKEEIRASLGAAGLRSGDPRIGTVCIEKMLEAWLLADERALGKFLGSDPHPVRVPREKNPERVPDPKAALSSRFRSSGSRHRRYVDWEHAIEIARRIPDLARLRRVPSFRYFETKLR
jgi:hypothetical protein